METAKYPPKKILFWIIGIAIILEFIIFKCCYPYASFIKGDSYVYLQSAHLNVDIDIRPIGYSRFLRLFSVFTHSDTAFVAFQYLAIQSSTLWLLHTLLTIFPVSKLTTLLLVVFFVLNPIFLYLSNYVSSDALFLALSVTWFTLLIRIIQSPTPRLIGWQALFLFLAFIVRYNALYYPFLSAIAFILCHLSVKKKIISIGASFLPIILFIWFTSNKYYELTGIRQFTPFSSWQLANNALYAYRYIDDTHLKTPPLKFQVLDQLVRHYFDTTRDLRQHPEETAQAGTHYMWAEQSPLNIFMNQNSRRNSSAIYLKKWASMGPLYSEYGSWLIRQYSNAYFNHYLVPNAVKFYVPPVEYLAEYNTAIDSLDYIAQYWFRYKSNKINPAFGHSKVKILEFMPFTMAILNAAFLLGCIGQTLSTGTRLHSLTQKILLLIILLWMANFGFSVIASSIALRFQLFGFQVFGAFAFLLFDRIITASPHHPPLISSAILPTSAPLVKTFR